MIEQSKISNELKYFIFILNQIFDIEKKSEKLNDKHSIHRNIQKLREHFESGTKDKQLGLSYHNPIGEKYDETRTDCEASIAGANTEHLIITEVIKPVIRVSKEGKSFIIQKAIVIAESKKDKG